MLRGDARGFTLIELMIVVVIIGVLGALALPRYGATTQNARQSEAELLLKQIYHLQELYFQKHDHYADDVEALRDIGWAPPVTKHYHLPEITEGGGEGSTSYRACMKPFNESLPGRSIDETRTFGEC